ncbi:MAG: Asp-tRNA(Asn)/Glu-tRNA(Gln) amidotransferase subunit GatA [Acidobacteria bacterium]|nr:MAG: Asp-tRNA(Asn)/Glu-tRNA(Gln) amidotransferase subunit GatA [Acidobacteriota bacterium]REK02600.1 MAG: Asp-tRNA(Asn)/Glu-tRNA(Gln) amidotransferase subunit GatA [Acidobacteriota bacterium]REK13597.1 MAG: Asp-tRNA(Asn)/Glu-tRNA(Gln) amidotransferase subunit GatA [Acidobacteriota bacterium]REK41591.1 MAG: Asp-tRNA(Asn)/Glu-tRNA(Gln) amidotransferase subunit GatA [Acidobacteriota bacterium]
MNDNNRHPDAKSAIDAANRLNPELNAFLSVYDEVAPKGEGPLKGMPIAVKDNICTKGRRTTCGSRILGDFEPQYDATAVERLENAGAVIIGKTNMDEFAMGSSNENSAFGPVKNPWDVERVPGGSSGGSAAAVASGIVRAALGSETGGSVRQPASFCGVFGLKPTYGRISRYGLVAFASSLDQIGVFGRSAEDIAAVLTTIAGRDENDATSADVEVPDYVFALGKPIEGKRIGVPRALFGEGLDSDVQSSVETALDGLKSKGAEIVDIELPYSKYAIAVYYIIATAEASSNLARYDGVRYGFRAEDAHELREMYFKTRKEGFGPEVKRRIMLGTYVLSSGYYDAYYAKAQKVRTLLKKDFSTAFQDCDVIATPTSPTTAFRLGEKSDDPLAMYLSDIYTASANLAGIPGLSVPCGTTDDGLPVGLQLLGPNWSEDLLLNIASVYEKAFPVEGEPGIKA